MFLEDSLEFTSTKRGLQIKIIAIQDYNNCLAPQNCECVQMFSVPTFYKNIDN